MVKNAQWADDPMVGALAERAQNSAESDSDFILLERVSALYGPNELASIHVAKGLAMFKCEAASVCYKIAASRRQSLLAPLSVKDGEQATDAVSELKVLVKPQMPFTLKPQMPFLS